MHNPSDLVESMIDSIVAGQTSAQDVVSSVLSRDGGSSDQVVFAEGEKPVCPDCGSSNLEEGFVESEGHKVGALKCSDCDCLLIEEQEHGDEPELVEAELDEDDPCCPVCNSNDLSGEVVESDGNEDLVLTCGSCNTRMVVVG